MPPGDPTGTGPRDVRAQAFVALYDQSLSDIYSYLRSRVGDRFIAEDLAQEVFLAGARRVSAGEAVNVPWLMAVARHKMVDHWRARGRDEHRLAAVAEADRVALPTQEQPLDGDRVQAALERLNGWYRLALVLRHVDGLSVPEVAAQLERTIAATEQVLTRARAAFRVAYEEADDV